jgi:hypothetical protein
MPTKTRPRQARAVRTRIPSGPRRRSWRFRKLCLCRAKPWTPPVSSSAKDVRFGGTTQEPTVAAPEPFPHRRTRKDWRKEPCRRSD